MRLAIFGLGQVGAVSAACLCELGHDVLGLDVDREKMRRVNAGESPIAEASVGGLVAAAVRAGRLGTTSDVALAVAWAEASLVCVDAPGHESGSQDTSQVLEVIQTIGEALRGRANRHTVVVRSTLLPGTTLGLLAPALERASGKRCGRDIGLAYCPEFLRAGSAVRDFMRPPYTIIGGSDAESFATAEDIYRGVKAPVHVVPVPDAEMLKYASNAFHALKVTFANEVGSLSKRQAPTATTSCASSRKIPS
jgi:GDP-mannose 6-dehydrogenase